MVWDQSIQIMLDTIEANLTDELTLEMLASRLHYSNYYCTKRFHKLVGISLRNYIRLRKLTASVFDLRDTNNRIIDIAIKYGFTSQEAYTRSFTKEFGISPAKYRKLTHPLPLFVKRNTYNPYLLGIPVERMKNKMNEVQVSIQVIPPHQFVGIKDIHTDSYFAFWKRQEEELGRDCYAISGFLESMKGYNGVIGGWFYENGKKGYLFGVEMPTDDETKLPDYLERIQVEESLYAIFHYPPYDYLKEDGEVSRLLDEKMKKWNPSDYGYAYNYTHPIYQRHNPEQYGQAICVPIKEFKK